MMNEWIHKTAGLSFIGTAVLVILLHAAVPHYHHIDFIDDHLDNYPGVTHHTEEDNDAKHCHAFNELAVDKITNLSGFQFNPKLYLTPGFIITVPCNEVPGVYVADEEQSSLFLIRYIALRAPPSYIA